MNRLFVIVAAAALLAACTAEQAAVLPAGMEKVRLDVSVPVSSMTKLTDAGDESAVNRVQVFVFREDGSIDASGIAGSGSIELDCTAGERSIVAVVNTPEIDGIYDMAGLEEKMSVLQDNSAGSLVMSGIMNVTLTASASVTVPVRRLAAKVSIERIDVDFALEQYQDAGFEITGIYLTNVAADAHFIGDGAPSSWLNVQGKDLLQNELVGDLGMSVPIADGAAYETAHHFYCYPNPYQEDSFGEEWSPRHTRLVVEASLAGKTCYYAMTMPVIEANHAYVVTGLNITRPGSSDPEQEIRPEEASFTIKVEDWEDGYSGSFEI